MQVFLGIIDLLAIALISILIITLGTDSHHFKGVGLLSKVQEFLKLGNRSLEFLCVAGFISFIVKTILNTILIKLTFKFLSKSLSQTATLTFWKLINSSYQFISAKRSQEFANSLTSGAMAATTLLLGSFSVFIVEFILHFQWRILSRRVRKLFQIIY